MRIRNFILAGAAIASLGLAACEGAGNAGTKEKIGSVAGAIGGGVIGSQIGGGSGRYIATGVGTLLGAWIGNEIGSSLDRADLAYAQRAEQRAYTAPLGQTISWNNPESGNYGTVTPIRDGQTNSGSYCREYEQTIYVGGRSETGVGVACQQSDGTWRIQN